MSSYVNAGLRRLVESRAHHACEYCLIRESDTYLDAKSIMSLAKSMPAQPKRGTWPFRVRRATALKERMSGR